MSGLGYDEQGRALEGEARAATVDADPLKRAAQAQSADVEAAVAAIEGRDATRESIADLLRQAARLPDPAAVLLAGSQPVWAQWLQVLPGTPLPLAARRDLVTVARGLPEAERIAVLTQVFRVPVAADGPDFAALDDLLEDAADQPVPDDESGDIEADGTVHLDSAADLLADLLDEPAPPAPDMATLIPIAASALQPEGVLRALDVAGFVRACAPGAASPERAIAVVAARFDADPLDDEAGWWRAVARLRRRFPLLVAALEAARGGGPQQIAVRGGHARVDLAQGTLGVLAIEAAG